MAGQVLGEHGQGVGLVGVLGQDLHAVREGPVVIPGRDPLEVQLPGEVFGVVVPVFLLIGLADPVLVVRFLQQALAGLGGDVAGRGLVLAARDPGLIGVREEEGHLLVRSDPKGVHQVDLLDDPIPLFVGPLEAKSVGPLRDLAFIKPVRFDPESRVASADDGGGVALCHGDLQVDIRIRRGVGGYMGVPEGPAELDRDLRGMDQGV